VGGFFSPGKKGSVCFLEKEGGGVWLGFRV
jgi:hypothetical protein